MDADDVEPLDLDLPLPRPPFPLPDMMDGVCVCAARRRWGAAAARAGVRRAVHAILDCCSAGGRRLPPVSRGRRGAVCVTTNTRCAHSVNLYALRFTVLFVVCWFAQIKPSKSEAGRHLSVPFLDLCGAPPPGFTCLLLGGVEETRDGC